MQKYSNERLKLTERKLKLNRKGLHSRKPKKKHKHKRGKKRDKKILNNMKLSSRCEEKQRKKRVTKRD